MGRSEKLCFVNLGMWTVVEPNKTSYWSRPLLLIKANMFITARVKSVCAASSDLWLKVGNSILGREGRAFVFHICGQYSDCETYRRQQHSSCCLQPSLLTALRHYGTTVSWNRPAPVALRQLYIVAVVGIAGASQADRRARRVASLRGSYDVFSWSSDASP